MRTTLPALALLCTLPLAAVAADNGATVLNLSASASQELANDEVNASLYVQDRLPQAGALADRINKLLNRARQDAEGFRKVTFSSGSYNTWPDYDKNGKITGWQARAEIKLKSQDFTDTAELIARLQKYMALEGVHRRQSAGQDPATRQRAEHRQCPARLPDDDARQSRNGRRAGS